MRKLLDIANLTFLRLGKSDTIYRLPAVSVSDTVALKVKVNVEYNEWCISHRDIVYAIVNEVYENPIENGDI